MMKRPTRMFIAATVILMVANLVLLVALLTLATGPAGKVFWVTAVFQCLSFLGSAAVAGLMIARRYADPRRPHGTEADYHGPPRTD